MNKLNVLSLFDGISCGQIALERAGIKVNKYFASEIDKHAITVAQHNYPNTIQLGDVANLDVSILPKIFLLQGGSPCQSFSFAGDQNGMSTTGGIDVTTLEHYLTLKEQGFKFKGQSYLFWEYVRVLTQLKPKYFLLENVKMKKKWQDIISGVLGIEPIEINSALVSAQNRKRLYWTNIKNVAAPQDKLITLQDIVDSNSSSYEFLHKEESKNGVRRGTSFQYDGTGKGNNSQNYRAYFLDGKAGCLRYTAPHGAKILLLDGRIRKTTRIEHERLQNLPEGYTELVPLNKAKAAIGNGWTVDVISHIFSFLPREQVNAND